VAQLEHGDTATVRGVVIAADNVKTRGSLVLTKAVVEDGSGVIVLTWFNQKFRKEQFLKLRGKQVIAYGAVTADRWGLSMANPDWEVYSEESDPLASGRVVPVYALTEGLFQNQLRKILRGTLDAYASSVRETLPEDLRDRLDLMDISQALTNIHFPESWEAMEAARNRLVFEELFVLQLMLAMRKRESQAPGAGIGFRRPESFDEELKQLLPFDLTGAQQRVIGEIAADMARPLCMNRLLQGDVGSGKTAVALAAMLMAVRNGYQTALMAPTEILAEQHYLAISRMVERLSLLGFSVDLSPGSPRAEQRREVLERVASGETRIVIGTHALIQEGVDFQRLGLVIVDEQHRFGVMQRAALMDKGLTPDMLVMTATPIPRTLTLTVYGDLDISIIDELPPGRKPVKTHWRNIGQRRRVYEGVGQVIAKGRQAYVVCPLVEESEKLQVRAASELAEELQSKVFPDLRVGLMHGQMKTDEKDRVMADFRDGKIDILVSTTVIEVGVDVPNAAVIVVEDADRFGLAQLHQLRGRVGRGEHQSFCVLICEGNSEDSIKRMQVMSSTNDGFVIAEEDLKLRGAGDLGGTKQTGEPTLQIADIFRDIGVLETARKEALETIERDPSLASPQYASLRKTLMQKHEALQLVAVG